MISVFDLQQLEQLLEDFYRITQIRITVFDQQFQEIISVPDSRPGFCQLIRMTHEGRSACARCDAAACAYAAGQSETYLYRCHAGLTEVIMPLHVGKALVGYLFFGHVFDYDTMEDGWQVICQCCENYPVDSNRLKNSLKDMPMISRDYIQSAAKILRMTAPYLVLERMATLQEDTAAAKLDNYLSEHYREPISSKQICRDLNISRTRLYELSGQIYGCGVSEHIRQLRMEHAKHLLIDCPEMTIKEIAAECSFSDYNYFIAVFSKQMGEPPGSYRKRYLEV